MPCKKPHHTSEGSNEQKGDGSFEILPKGLNIVWGNDPRYWNIPDTGAAELIQVSWLEVTGKVSIKDRGKYRVSFEVRVKEDGFGWQGTEVLVMAKIGKRGRYQFRVNKLSPSTHNIIIPQLDNGPLDIAVDNPPSDLHFGLYEVWSGKWKGGLQIIKATVEPVT
ncbi:hypothetical protein VNO80_19830 [Phaseolus coccineus]|uniref:Protein PHLOEM PROTEIN 2-LIKE A9-like n=1 Tax=Phaseolus coccineus TaxID=3886 RepID=A0AAN9MGT4_PHACN